ncbi:hypothetical protein DJ017_19880 [Phenylobacterium soli]|uniref:Uncharacterized protein n=2 Tax=Phenylobacterium soli TaxID=2170551 RepID=A0A328A8L5_9CAUL|nr:hypothetical protein DJ017_19880 [Phenylobacterium soli]
MTTAPISLYFDLEPGQVADLEVVSRASLAFAAAVKDLAFFIDPSLDIRIELQSATESSLDFHNLIRNLRKKAGESLSLGALILAAAEGIGTGIRDYEIEKAIAHIQGDDHKGFTPEQLSQLRAMADAANEGRVAQPPVQRFYQEIDRDPAIRGVGTSLTPGEKPRALVPRSEFAARAGRAAPREETVNRRTRVEDIPVVLISPVLVAGTRRWKLKSAEGEFGATIKDEEFVRRVLNGTTNVRMKAGIEMSVELETVEEFRHGVWQVIEHNVLRVFGLTEPPTQGDLLPPDGDNDQSEDGDDD